jgi:hypothetical protein
MPHLSYTFSSPYAGKLTVRLQGSFWEGANRRLYGQPPSNTTVNLYVRVSVNGVLSDPIDRYAPTVSLELDYPGGGVPWAVQTQTVSYVTAGATNFGFEDLTAVLKLLKR